MGLKVEFSGIGKVTEQSIENGVKVEKRSDGLFKIIIIEGFKRHII